MQFDSRDHEQFPRNGWLIDSKATFYRASAGSDFDADVWALSVNRYLPVRNRDVLALRARIRTASEDAPFFLLSTLGGSKDLRGYPSGRYRDRMMYALQGEYRWHFSERWIFTGFLGFGEVMDSLREAGSDYLPAAGLGARFVLSTKHRVGISADVAVGNDGAEVYLGVGEAF
jgi:outer membrane translocation and assembly module TamA